MLDSIQIRLPYDAAVFDVGVLGDLVELRGHFVTGLLHHFGEVGVRVVEQIVGVVELDEPARVHHHDAVGVHDGVESVGDRQHRAVREPMSYRSLDELVGPG